MFSQQKTYRFEKQILYSQINTESLYGAFVEPSKVGQIGGYRRIMAGSYLAAGGGLVKRALSLSTYKGDGKLFVNNPYPFAVGDIIRVIGQPTPKPTAEHQAVVTGNAPTLGTITTVVGDLVQQKVQITLSALVAGNVISLWIEGIIITYVVQSTSVGETAKKLRDAIAANQGGLSILDELEFNPTDTALEVKHKEPGEIFTLFGSIAQGSGASVGQLTVEVVSGVGQLEFTPAAGVTTLPPGSKVGTISDVPLGVIAHDYYLNECEGNERPADLAAYDKAMVYKRALPYLDGHLVNVIPGLKYMPHYADLFSDPESFFKQ